LKTLLAIIGILFGVIPDCDGAVCKGYLSLKAELPTIRKAAERNGIHHRSDDWYLLLAIRKAENGRDGCQFGIKDPRAWDTNLDTQAGWAAATIVKNHQRFGNKVVTDEFICFLQKRYCPDIEGGKDWLKNVRFFFKKFTEEIND
jgi:hypothetical protein